jgi:hypothetical protein
MLECLHPFRPLKVTTILAIKVEFRYRFRGLGIRIAELKLFLN